MENAVLAVWSGADTVLGVAVGLVVGYMFTSIIERMRVRARFNAMISRQRTRCRAIRDDQEFTYDDSLEEVTLQVLERAKEAVAPA